MGWLELRLVVPRSAIDEVSQALFERGASGVQEDYLPGEVPPPASRGIAVPRLRCHPGQCCDPGGRRVIGSLW